MPPRRRLVATLAACTAFGVVMAVLKGQDSGVRDVVGNLSAPWVALAFLAGMAAPRAWGGAVVGGLATVVAFVGFYAAEAAVLDLGPHPWWVDLRLTLGSGHVYEAWGVPAGVAFGGLGALWATRRNPLAPVLLGAVFVAEPAIVWLLARAHVWGDAQLFHYPALWVAEVAAGFAATVLLVRRAGGEHDRSPQAT